MSSRSRRSMIVIQLESARGDFVGEGALPAYYSLPITVMRWGRRFNLVGSDFRVHYGKATPIYCEAPAGTVRCGDCKRDLPEGTKFIEVNPEGRHNRPRLIICDECLNSPKWVVWPAALLG
jgi:hypothetical protein